ncbi:MAG: cytochrome c, partial [Alphaproteobacteria bacterium]
LIQRPAAADEYLLWTISEGGAMFDTPMPGFKNTLSRDEIWSIIAFMRAGFPASDFTPPDFTPPDSAPPEPRR